MNTTVLLTFVGFFSLLVFLIVSLLYLARNVGAQKERLSNEVRDAQRTNAASTARRSAEQRIAEQPDRLRDNDGFRRD